MTTGGGGTTGMGDAGGKVVPALVHPISKKMTKELTLSRSVFTYLPQAWLIKNKQPPMISHRRLSRSWQSVYKPGSVGQLA